VAIHGELETLYTEECRQAHREAHRVAVAEEAAVGAGAGAVTMMTSGAKVGKGEVAVTMRISIGNHPLPVGQSLVAENRKSLIILGTGCLTNQRRSHQRRKMLLDGAGLGVQRKFLGLDYLKTS